jgi:hypothetical protein
MEPSGSPQSRAAITARVNCNSLTKADVMKLVRMDGDRIGLFVLLPKGPYAIDIANSLGVFPHDPLSNGLLNGALKDGHDWSIIVKHWVHLRWPLKKLLSIAMANPDTPRLVLQSLVDATGAASERPIRSSPSR